MCHCGNAPARDGNRIADLRTVFINKPPKDYEPDGIGGLEGSSDVAILNGRPADLLLKRGCKDTEDISVEIIDCRSKKKQTAYRPPVAADLLMQFYSFGHARSK